MSEVWRQFLVLRGVIFAVLCVYAVALARLWGPLGALPVVGWVLVTAATVALLLSLRSGRGELWMTDGRRAQTWAYLLQHAADTVELLVLVPVYTALVVIGWWLKPELLVLGAVVTTLTLLMVRFFGPYRWQALCVAFAVRAAGAHRHAETLAWCARAFWWSRPLGGVQQTADRLRSAALLGLGQPAEGRRLAEAGWGGGVDASAWWVAKLRLGLGDPRLALSVIGGHAPVGPVEEFEAQCTRALLVAHGQDVDFDAAALAALAATVPARFGDEGYLALATWAQSQGKSADSVDFLMKRRFGADQVEVFYQAMPWAGRMLEDAQAGRASERPRTVKAEPVLGAARAAAPGSAANVFAAPSEDAETPLKPGSGPSAGVLPTEWVVVGVRAGPMRWVRLFVLLALLPICLAAAGLVAFAAMQGEPGSGALAGGAAVLSAAVLVLAVTAFADLVAERLPGGDPRLVLSDGRRFSARGFQVYLGFRSGSALFVGAAFLAGAALTLSFDRELAWVSGVLIFLGIFALAGLWQRRFARRLVSAAFFGDTAEFGAAGAGPALAGLRGAQLAGLRALSGLWAGDPERGLKGLEDSLALVPAGAGLLVCFRAQAGGLELAHALQRAVPEEMGPAWCEGLALALAGLHSGECGRLGGRVAEWELLADALPNRFGALLGLAVGGVRLARGERPAAGFYALDAGDLAGVARGWPVLAPAHAALVAGLPAAPVAGPASE